MGRQSSSTKWQVVVIYFGLGCLTHGCDQPRVSSLVTRLADKNPPPIRREAAHDLASLGPRATPAIPALLKVLRSKDDSGDVRTMAIIALNQIGPSALDDLLKALEDNNPYVRGGVLEAFGLPNPKWEREFASQQDLLVLPRLLEALKDEHPYVRASAAKSSFWVGNGAGKTTRLLKPLINALKDHDGIVRREAAVSLGWIGRSIVDAHRLREAVKPLADALLHDMDPDVRKSSAWALGQFQPIAEEAIPPLVNALNDPDVCDTVCYSLLNLRSARNHAIPLLEKAFAGGNQETRYQVIRAMRFLSPLPQSVVPFLVRALDDESPKVRDRAAATLGSMRSTAHQACPALRAARWNNPFDLKITITWALWSITGKDQEAIPTLRQGLRHPDEKVRAHAAKALAALAEKDFPAQWAVPMLRHLTLEDESPDVRAAAEIALDKILRR